MSRPRKNPTEGQHHVVSLLGAEYVRCTALIENCNRELADLVEQKEAWTAELAKWSQRQLAIAHELGVMGAEVPPSVPPRAKSDLTDAWEFEPR